jgi:hypothetical protein
MTLDLLIDRIATARTWTRNLLSDIEESRWFESPAPGVQHVAWQVGHLAASQVVLIHSRCFARKQTDVLGEPFVKQFGRGSAPVPDATAYPPIAEIRRVFDAIHVEGIQLIRTLSDADLQQPTHGDPHPMFVTKGQCIGMVAMHESFHAGQIALTRRIFGKSALR